MDGKAASSRFRLNTLLLKSEGRGGPPGDHEWSPGGLSLWPSEEGGKAFALDKRVSRACPRASSLSHRRNSGGSFSSGTQEGPSGTLDSCGRKLHPQSFGSNTLLLKSEGRGGPPGDHRVVSRSPLLSGRQGGVAVKPLLLTSGFPELVKSKTLSHRRNSGGSFSSGTQEGPSEDP